MRELLGNFVGMFLRDDNFRQNLGSYMRFLESKDGAFFKTMLQTLMSMMVEDTFSKRHTQLDPVEKDVVQRSYYNIYEILLFLSSPTKWIKEKTAYKMSTVPSSSDIRPIGKSKEKGR